VAGRPDARASVGRGTRALPELGLAGRLRARRNRAGWVRAPAAERAASRRRVAQVTARLVPIRPDPRIPGKALLAAALGRRRPALASRPGPGLGHRRRTRTEQAGAEARPGAVLRARPTHPACTPERGAPEHEAAAP